MARPRLAVAGLDLSPAALRKALDDPALASCELVFVEGGLEEAFELARTKRVDGVAGAYAPDELALLAKHAGAEPLVELLVRGTTRVLVLSLRASELDVERAAALIATTGKALARDLAIARPRIALCSHGDADVAPLAARARALGANVVGPSPAEEAFAQEAHAVCTVTRDQARMGLALAGREATARLVLGAPFVRTSEDPAERAARTASLRASVLLAARFAPLRGELVATREEREEAEKRARVSSVAVSARSARDDRCPYCRREFTDEEPGLLCAKCESPHHRACIHEHGRCTVHGCGSTTVVRAGAKIAVARLGGDGTARVPFVTRLGAEGEGVLLVEAPIDDPLAQPRHRELVLELESREVVRGGLVSGALVVHAPREFKASGGTFRLRAALEVRPSEERPRIQPIVDREAIVIGDPSRGLIARLSDGVNSLLGTGDYLSIPAGTRRYPFAFRLRSDHPATVKNPTRRLKGDIEIVTSSLEATLAATSGGVLSALSELLVR